MKCKWPLNHISISSTGKMRPCCAWQEQSDQPDFSNTTFKEYTESDFFKKLVDDLRNDKFGVGCSDCVKDEQLGRGGMIANGERRYSQTEKFSPVDTEIKFGNLCNAGCIMCSSYNSSLIETENQKNSELLDGFRNLKTRNHIAWWEDPEKFRELAREVSSYRQIRFTGGEPTVRGLLTKFLTEVAKNNTDIRIQISTNGGKIGDRLLSVLSQFKEISIQLSIDGYAEANDFIRWPITWESINHSVDQLKKLDNTRIRVETSLQVCTLESLPELISWCQRRELGWDFSPVYTPEFLQPCVASDDIKNKVLQIPDLNIGNYLEFNSSEKNTDELRDQCIKYLDTLDQIRGTDWKSVIKI